jgi:glutathione S-transferase
MVDLYISATCPFCIKVIRAAEQMGLEEGRDYRIVDAAVGTPGRKTVVETGGKGMVPFLIDADISMYESDDIISYLREHYAG